MFFRFFLCLPLLIATPAVFAQEDTADVRQAIEAYINGTAYSDINMLKKTFYEDAKLYLDHKDHPVFIMTAPEFIALFEKGDPGEFNGRYGNVLAIDQTNGVATGKAEILIPADNSRFIDYFLLKKIAGDWKIISKLAVREETRMTGAKAALIIEDGALLSNTALQYRELRDQGYMVTFITDAGGRAEFSDHVSLSGGVRSAVFNPDFMFASSNTLSRHSVTLSTYEKVVTVICKD